METDAGRVATMRIIMLIVLLLLMPSQALVAQVGQIPVVALLDLSGDGVAESELGMVRNLLTYAISDTYMAEAVSGTQLERLLVNTDEATRNCKDISCAAEVGKVAETDGVIAGSLKRQEDGLILVLQAMDVASTELTASYSRLHEDLDDIVDNLGAIALQLVRELTGEQFPASAILEHKGLSLLKVVSDTEGASVYMDGVLAGKISGGQLWKIVPYKRRITVTLQKRGFYSYRDGVFVNQREMTIQADLEEMDLHRFAVDGVFGGGSMGSLRFTVFPVADRWFISGGMGFTICCTDPLLMNLPLSLHTGLYLFPDRRGRLRFYTGLEAILSLIRVLEQRVWIDADHLVPDRLNTGFFLGTEYVLLDHLRTAFELSVFPYGVFAVPEEGSAVQLALILRVM